MKKIKKLLCIILAALLLASVGTVAAGAEEPVQPDMEALQQKFIAYLGANNVEHNFGGEEWAKVEYIIQTNDWTIFYGTQGTSNPMSVAERIGNYIFKNSSWQLPYKLGVYGEKNGTIIPLDILYTKEKIDITVIAKQNIPYVKIYHPGDIDMDGNLSVKDVLSVQKIIAKVINVDSFSSIFCDYDGNELINVRDVLGMQKEIAKTKK